MAADHFARRLKARGLGEAEIASASDELRRLLDLAAADPTAGYEKCATFVQQFGLTMDEVAYGDRAVQFDEFQRAYDALLEALAPFCGQSADPAPAYHVVDDSVGTRELLVEVLDPGMDWEAAKRSIAMSFSERFPLWSVILRMAGALDERVG